MTTMESYYLAVCIGAFITFAATLAYNDLRWSAWKKAPKIQSEAPHVSGVGFAR